MQFKKLIWMMAAGLLAASLSSCNIGKAPEPTQDVNAIYTAAAGTTIAQFSDQMTQTAQAVSPTPAGSPTPLATFTSLPTFSLAPAGTTTSGGTPFVFNTPAGTALPTLSTGGTGSTSSTASGCSDSAYVDQTVTDGTTFAANKKFTVGFQLNNTGTCAWGAGYSFVFVSGDQMGGTNIVITKADAETQPGQSNSFILKLQAPSSSGDHKGFWRMKDPKGNFFGSLVYIDIHVK